MGIGASLLGFRSIISSQRIDFITLAMDQIINGAAKWHYMTGGKINVPIVLRLIVGRVGDKCKPFTKFPLFIFKCPRS